MSFLTPSTEVRRRWDRFWLRLHARLDGDAADRVIPWVLAVSTFVVHVALAAAARRSGVGGTGLGPWLQAAWQREHGGVVAPVGGVDPATGSGSLVGEVILQASRFVDPTTLFTVVQALAIAATMIPLWRLARDRGRLRAGAALVVLLAYALAPTLHRASLSPFHPELVALPALLGAYLMADRGHWVRYWLLIALALASRADLGLTVAALGALVGAQIERRHGTVTAVVGIVWVAAAEVVIGPELPSTALTPAGEFVARSTGPLAALPRLLSDPITEIGGLLAEPSVLFLVVVLAPLLFLPLVAFRRFAPALPCLALAMVADRAVQKAAEVGVLNLSPVAAHITPALAFVFLAVVFAVERIGNRSVTRVNVDRRVLSALLFGSILFFVTESPSTPYDRPWSWGGRGRTVQQREAMADQVEPDAAVAVSPTATALVAERARLVELPPAPEDITAERIDSLEDIEVVLLDTTIDDPVTREPRWRPEDVRAVLDRFEDAGFTPEERLGGIHLLERD